MKPPRPISIEEYLDGIETLRPMELVHGFVREPPAPLYGHQTIVTRTTVLLDQHVRTHGLGWVCVSPIDVVLDSESALVVQPDVVFVSTARSAIVKDRIWGAPDLVVEVLSLGTARRDRTEKLGWYRHYGVGECWLIDSIEKTIEIIDCGQKSGAASATYRTSAVLESRILPTLSVAAEAFFE